jgi:hypothetical protein
MQGRELKESEQAENVVLQFKSEGRNVYVRALHLVAVTTTR